MIKFFDITQEQLNNKEYEAESIYFCYDTLNIYYDSISEERRIHINTIMIVLDVEAERIAILSPIPYKLYFIKENKKIYTYSDSNWYCINDYDKYLTKTVTNAENTLVLNDNTEYRLTDIGSLTLIYPNDNFEVWMSIQFSSTKPISVSFPIETQYIGSAPTFNNGETWEISIKDGVAICWRVK